MTVYPKRAGLLLIVLLAGLVFPASLRAEPVSVSIAQLVGSPDQYAGKEILVEGILTGESVARMLLPPSPNQFVLTDPAGAQVLILTSLHLPRATQETMLSVHGAFYRIPLDSGRAFQFLVPHPGGLATVLPWWH